MNQSFTIVQHGSRQFPATIHPAEHFDTSTKFSTSKLSANQSEAKTVLKAVLAKDGCGGKAFGKIRSQVELSSDNSLATPARG
jgi:hypothetical protein